MAARYTLGLATLLVAAVLGLSTPATSVAGPGDGPGGPMLVVVNPGDPYGRYYAEILRAEGLNEFAVANVGDLSAQALAPYQVVVLAQTGLSDAQALTLAGWVQRGGDLVAMRPDPKLAGVFGLGVDGGDLAEGSLQADTTSGPGAGITGAPLQFHGTADRWSLAGARAVATLVGTANPAVTLRRLGSGQAAAFTYDLARSVVQTRQGNPAWAGLKRDGTSGPIRSDDLFFPDWVDLSRVAIPQADEQQRLLANLVTQMSAERVPLPRFWYFPRGERAVVVLTGDDHGQGGTASQFDRFAAFSRPGCSVADWQCVRTTSYVFPNTPLTDAQAAAYQAQGFELALHLDTGCLDFTPASLEESWSTQLAAFAGKWPSVAGPVTNRTHCIAWSDWAGEAKAELAHGVRLDTNYYYWPEAWIQNRPGVFTGSGIPMRFADADGSLIDVFQAPTQLTDESGIDIPAHIAALLDRALGPEGFFGAFTANMHTDGPSHPGADAIVAAAQARGVPVVSARQLLEWLDGRDGSSFAGVSFAANRLTFAVRPGAGARGLQAMLPVAGPTGALAGLTRAGVPVPSTPRTVKGVAYAVFDAVPGDYAAVYGTGGGGAAPGRPAARRKARRWTRLSPRTVRVSRRGRVTFRVACKRSEGRCRVALRLQLRKRTVALRSGVTIRGGRSAKVTLRLRPGFRRRVARARRVRVTAVVVVRDRAGHRHTSRAKVTVLARKRARHRG